MKHEFRSLALVLTLVCAAGTAGCDEEPVAPSNVPVGAPVIESFLGSVDVNGSAFYSFTVPQQGPVSLTLLSVTENGQPSEAKLGLNFGTPVGVGCTGIPTAVVGAGSTPQVTQVFPPGVYCARVSDPGQLSARVNFALNIARPR